MIFSSEYLQGLREVGINSQNLRNMIVNLAVRCSELEKELKQNGSNAKSDPQSANSADKTG